ncbi:MAG: ribonuclease P protein component [Candidatus Paceibacterota bacterium]
MIKKKFRLSHNDFLLVLKNGQKCGSPHFLISYLPNNLLYFRLGINLSSKIIKSAVQRNYLKRIIKAIFRDFFLKENKKQQNYFQKNQGYDIVIGIKKVFSKKDFQEIKKELELLFQKIISEKNQI